MEIIILYIPGTHTWNNFLGNKHTIAERITQTMDGC